MLRTFPHNQPAVITKTRLPMAQLFCHSKSNMNRDWIDTFGHLRAENLLKSHQISNSVFQSLILSSKYEANKLSKDWKNMQTTEHQSLTSYFQHLLTHNTVLSRSGHGLAVSHDISQEVTRTPQCSGTLRILLAQMCPLMTTAGTPMP